MDNLFYRNLLQSLTISNVVRSGCSCAMVFGGIIPYVPQYREIRKTQNADGFSTYVCLSLLIANTLRIVFWFGHFYEYPLLLQSIIMNFVMLAMVHECVKIKNQTQIIQVKPHFFMDFEARYFWEWTDFLSYVEFLAMFTTMTGMVMYFLIDAVWVVELFGFLAVFTEAMLGVPQFCRNLKKKSTLGMSKKMVFLWTLGDTFKTGYFIVRAAPVQFWICGCLQVLIDVLILTQVVVYRVISSPVKLLKGTQHIS